MRLTTVIAIFLALANFPSLAKTTGEVEIGGYLREVPMRGFSGDIKKFSEFRGKPLIINVWASWCGPCRAEMGALERLARRYGGKQLTVIGISTDDDGQAAAAFLQRAQITFANYLDNNVVLENMLGANKIPLTIFVDAHGRVVHKVSGSRAWDSPEAIDFIGQVLQVELKRLP